MIAFSLSGPSFNIINENKKTITGFSSWVLESGFGIFVFQLLVVRSGNKDNPSGLCLFGYRSTKLHKEIFLLHKVITLSDKREDRFKTSVA